MKHFFCGVLLALTLAGHARADITVPGANGSDGALTVTENTVIDLSLAPTGTWDQNNAANAGKGVYDPAKWAVVFKYSSVSIADGADLRFALHPSRAPVVWLVNGNVTITGSLNLTASVSSGEPGPGGFRGALKAGFGPGGGVSSSFGPSYARLGANNPDNPAKPYGNAQVVPLIGGSGWIQGGGGGAILIAATGTITVNGSIVADGFNGGTGGSIRLVADRITGGGLLSATGFANAHGRIRLETATTVDAPLADRITPPPNVSRPASPALLWPEVAAATARIVSIGGEAVATDPRGRIGPSADTLVEITATTIPVVIETTNVPTTSTVNLRMTPYDGVGTIVQATLTSGNAGLARWTANITPPVGTTALQVRVEAPQ